MVFDIVDSFIQACTLHTVPVCMQVLSRSLLPNVASTEISHGFNTRHYRKQHNRLYRENMKKTLGSQAGEWYGATRKLSDHNAADWPQQRKRRALAAFNIATTSCCTSAHSERIVLMHDRQWLTECRPSDVKTRCAASSCCHSLDTQTNRSKTMSVKVY